VTHKAWKAGHQPTRFMKDTIVSFGTVPYPRKGRSSIWEEAGISLSNFLRRYLIVLEHNNNIEEFGHYKHLGARHEKEKAAGNPDMREAIKDNTVVFSSLLALLYNLFSLAKLDWGVCGSCDSSANCTHGLLSNNWSQGHRIWCVPCWARWN
jgi:hypothetical protein